MSLDFSSSFPQFKISMAGGSKSGVFAFDSFKLDSETLMLYRDGVEIAIPPKVAKTLAVLVESAGSIISKEEVIERVWDDSIVEESNLTQYLYLLRKVLGTMPDGRPYIETLRRRGYRFNAHVQEVVANPPKGAGRQVNRSHADPNPTVGGIEREGNVLRVVNWKSPEVNEDGVSQHDVPSSPPAFVPRRSAMLPRLALTIVILMVAGALAVFFWPRSMPASINAESQKELSVVRLTDGFSPQGATISPDGNVFTYHEVDGDINRMFVQQPGQASRIEILASEQNLSSKTFSPDSRTIYFVASEKDAQIASVYRIPTMGGSPLKVLDNINGALSLSPDGNEMVFCRRDSTTGDTALVIAGSDGRAERVILERSNPRVLLPSPSWSPDGKLIAYGDRDLYAGGTVGTHRVNLLELATGKTSPLSTENWDTSYVLVWSPDGRGVFSLATRDGDSYSTRRDQIYFISYPEGISRRLTNEGNRHEPYSLGVTKSGDLLAVSSNRSSQIWMMNADGNAGSATQLTRGSSDGRAGLGILPDGRIAYLTRSADEISIMVANADGSGAKSLASGFPYLEELRVDPKGRFLVFSTLKSGKNHIFRIDVDGSNLKQLTVGEASSIDSSFSPDGSQLAFDSTPEGNDLRTYSVMRRAIEGGDPVDLVRGCFLPNYSPDGSMISCISSLTREVVVIKASDGAEIERYPLPSGATWNFGLGWTRDGSGFVYIHTDKRTSNLWILPRNRTKPRPLTNFTSGIIHRYAFSPDGSKIYIARGYPAQDAFLIKNFR